MSSSREVRFCEREHSSMFIRTSELRIVMIVIKGGGSTMTDEMTRLFFPCLSWGAGTRQPCVVYRWMRQYAPQKFIFSMDDKTVTYHNKALFLDLTRLQKTCTGIMSLLWDVTPELVIFRLIEHEEVKTCPV